jgi:hypothetical protein
MWRCLDSQSSAAQKTGGLGRGGTTIREFELWVVLLCESDITSTPRRREREGNASDFVAVNNQ